MQNVQTLMNTSELFEALQSIQSVQSLQAVQAHPAGQDTFRALLFIATPTSKKQHVTNCPCTTYDSDQGQIIVHKRIDDHALPAPYFICSFVQSRPDFIQEEDEYLNVFIRPLHITIGNPRYEITPSYVKPDIEHIKVIIHDWSLSREPILESCAMELKIWLQTQHSQAAYV